MATNAPWYVRYTTIHTDIKIPLVNDLLKNIRHSSQENACTLQPTNTGDCSRPTNNKTAQTT